MSKTRKKNQIYNTTMRKVKKITEYISKDKKNSQYIALNEKLTIAIIQIHLRNAIPRRKRGECMMKRTICFLLSLACAVSLAGCQNRTESSGSTVQQEGEGKLPTLRVAMLPFTNALGVKYMMEQGLDKENGFQIEPIMFSMGPPMNEALGADLWDIGVMGSAAVVGATTYGAYILGDAVDAVDGIALYVRPDSPIAQAKGFNPSLPEVLGNPDTVRESEILVTVGSTNQMMQMRWLGNVGVQDSEVKIINMDVPQCFQAFLAGEGDIVSLGVPFTYKAESEGWINIGGLKEMGATLTDVIIANPKSLKDEDTEKTIGLFMKLLFEAHGALEEDSELAVKLLLEYAKDCGMEITEEVARQDIERTKFLTAEDVAARENGSNLKQMAEFMVDTGKLDVDKLNILDKQITEEYVK